MQPKKPVTIRDIASRLDISFQAVAQALSDNPRGTVKVSEETRKRVRKMADKMGYRHNRAAQTLRTGRSGMLGVLSFQGIDQIGIRRLHHSIEEIKKIGLSPVVHHVDSATEETCTQACNEMIDAKVDGVLLLNPTPNFKQDHITRLQATGRPVASIGSPWLKGIPRYLADKPKGFEMLVRHLIEEGYRKIALLCADLQQNKNRQYAWHTLSAREGFESAIKWAGGKKLTIEPHVYPITFEAFRLCLDPAIGITSLYCAGYMAMRELIETRKVPEALVCQVDAWAVGALRACAEGGLRVPHDMALAGFENDPVSAVGSVPLTTVEHPLSKLCHKAVTGLVEIMNGKAASSQQLVRIPCELIVRQSTMRTPCPRPQFQERIDSMFAPS